MGLRHDNPNFPPQAPPRTQRLTADESCAVIAPWQQERVEQTGLTDHPAVPDVAEGLDIPVEEVQRLLAEVRAQRLEEERLLAQEQELKRAETQLAAEEARLADVQQQRARIRREESGWRRQTSSRRQSARVEPVPWEVWQATHPPPQWVETELNTGEDVSQQSPPWLTSAAEKVGMVLLCLVWGLALSLLAWVGLLMGLWGSH